MLVRVFSRLPDPIGHGFARALDAGTPVFHQINYLGSCAGPRPIVQPPPDGGRRCDRVIAKLQHSLSKESETNHAGRSMAFPVRWDPFFTRDHDPPEQVYRYPGKHFDFHRAQLTLG